MSEIKKLTLTDLIKNKEKYTVKQDQKEDLFIPRLDQSITIKRPEKSLCMDALQMAETDSEKADAFVVYNVCVDPNLKDTELLKAFDCVEPTDVIDQIFEPGEVIHIAKVAFELAGYNKGIKRVQDIKN